MSILSAQSIRAASIIGPHGLYQARSLRPEQPLITPFVEHDVVNGKSYGLSACTYDCRADQSLTLYPGRNVLGSTMERFCFPANICGSVLDKSSWARMGVSAFNTHLDPGWEGYLTVELINFSQRTIYISPGDPICQVKFEWLDHTTDLPYKGKYQDQERGPQEAR